MTQTLGARLKAPPGTAFGKSLAEAAGGWVDLGRGRRLWTSPWEEP
jgi:hypothetical protein